ncbi:MAG: DUF4139 domain-containing protein [Rhodospirillales bacterium]|nr:MAG: DUF4139 domain-containing protein [Rhodospirillales bacterium]
MRYAALAAAGALLAGLPAAGASEVAVPEDSRTHLAVTVYGNQLALVQDRRRIVLDTGEQSLSFTGVSRQVIPSSAFVAATEGVRVLSLEHRFDLLTPEALLRRSLGREVGVVRTHPTDGTETVEPAEVLSVEAGVVLRYRDRIETGVPGRLVFDAVPEGLTPTPALVATVATDEAAERELDLVYLTNGLSWQADYVLELDDDTGRLTLTGFATVHNVSGTSLPGASLALMAGDVRRVSPPGMPPMPTARNAAVMAMEAAPDAMEREAIADLHLYTVAEPVTLADLETRQLALLSAADVPFTRSYVSESRPSVMRPVRRDAAEDHPEVRINFDNDPETGPGEPLPAGIVRVFGRDAGDALRFLGEQQIAQVPVGRSVELAPGRAFDITVSRVQTEFTRAGLADDAFESAHRITVGNGKDQAVTVTVVELMTGDWTILAESAPHTKTAADRAEWSIEVPAQGEATVTYRVRVRR